ncbi:alpha-(1,3)-fucosyltransferase C-like isoform X2 [Portunus trituberculatus]|uniref:alpha-(1,3)-fucosyltransferase C-like isoform X2 n=1 Tax=Portunus trituberculatus TaxID=210409 RepID=UPI001E1CFE6D|nr:alpha-(1,3)-fucosyltransferase C-like isoform X2 [Portunus trituberculatus]
MKNARSLKLMVIYLCLLAFAILLVVFQSRHEYFLRWRNPIRNIFRMPKMKGVAGKEAERGERPNVTAATDRPLSLNKTHPPLKYILVWTVAYGNKTRGYAEGQSAFKKQHCKVDTCFLTGNRKLLPVNNFDAILFHLRSMNPTDLPAVRSPHQRWVFFEMESASYVYQNINVYNGLFNWTMTYRLDSDIQDRYGAVLPGHSPSPPASSSPYTPERNYAKGKTKMAAWFVSNCNAKSGRDDVVKKMKTLMKIDVYGGCGKLKCTKWGKECYALLDKHYKFYLSFENSLCTDYVTEKLFEILRHDVVPVVFGLANYTYITPSHSVINVLDFPNVKALVNHLKYLDKNDTAYNEYFKWKAHYYSTNNWPGLCELCRKVHQDNTPKVYQNMKQWFQGQGGCRSINVPLQ